ncbi:MAG: hypothetical protein Q8L55_04960 [Phycisphaerales bacterium]|nr:hypothetical protein [Phycisphaerales bacterium]
MDVKVRRIATAPAALPQQREDEPVFGRRSHAALVDQEHHLPGALAHEQPPEEVRHWYKARDAEPHKATDCGKPPFNPPPPAFIAGRQSPFARPAPPPFTMPRSSR